MDPAPGHERPTPDPAARPAPRPLSLGRRLLFTGVALAAFLGLFEVVLRISGNGPTTGKGRPTVTGYFWLADAHLGWRNRPDGSYESIGFAGAPVATTDAHGFRNGHGWATRGDRDVVAMVGDSTTFCAEVDDEHTSPSALARALGDEHELAFLNAGVRGYNTLQVERSLRRLLDAVPRVRAVVYTYVPNDYVETRMPRIYWPFVAPTAEWREGRLVEVEPSGCEIPEGTCAADFYAERERDERTARPVWTWLRDRCAVLSFGSRKWGDVKERLRWRKDGRPGAETRKKWAPWAQQTGGDECLRALLSRMQDACDGHGARFLVTAFATRTDDPDLAPLWAACQAVGVRFADVSGAFHEAETAYAARKPDGRHDSNHYSPHGAETFARALAPAVRELLRR